MILFAHTQSSSLYLVRFSRDKMSQAPLCSCQRESGNEANHPCSCSNCIITPNPLTLLWCVSAAPVVFGQTSLSSSCCQGTGESWVCRGSHACTPLGGRWRTQPVCVCVWVCCVCVCVCVCVCDDVISPSLVNGAQDLHESLLYWICGIPGLSNQNELN